MTEDEMENMPGSLDEPRQKGAVASIEKHASITVVVPSNHSQAKPSGSSVIDPSPSLGLSSPRSLDKINNLTQKEIALSKVGVTREKAYRVISQALDAMKWVDSVDEQGNVGREYVADLDKQRWGAEMAIKMFGDMIERKEIEHDIGDKTLDRFRAMSVSDLKARAADLLLGRTKVVDAEIIR